MALKSAARAALRPEAGRMLSWRLHAYGAPAELRLESARRPALRAPDHLLVRVRSASLNPIDLAMIGGYGREVLNTLRLLEGEGGGGVEFPLVPGRDFAGEVVAVGAGVRRRVGERVWGVVPPHWQGSHAEYVVARERWCGQAPEALGAAAGGALYAALSATAALRAAGLPAGSGAARGRTVLVLGLGGAGHVALQLLAAEGAAVVVGCNEELAPAALQAGATLALDRHAPDYDDRLIAAGPYDAILDCAGVGGAGATARGWRFARYVTLSSPLLRETDARGLPGGAAAAACHLASQCYAAASAARGGEGAGGRPRSLLPPHVRWAYFTPDERDIELLRRRAQSGQFRVLVERVYPWRHADEAYARLAAGHARGKLLLDFTEEG